MMRPRFPLSPDRLLGDNHSTSSLETGAAMSQAASTYESSLLLTLEEISRLVSHSHDPAETLNNVVRLVQGRFHTAVCSVYLLEPQSNLLVLSATVGLRPDSIGRVRMCLDEGLTGLVAQHMTPVMVADAFQHPRFKYFPEAGEDPYHSFLGVPLVESGTLQGVLVVQTVEPRTFTPNEVRMLVTVAAQVASLVGDAQLLEQVAAAAHARPAPALAAVQAPPHAILHGVGLSPGRGMGRAYVVDGFDEWRNTVPLAGGDPVVERRRLAAATDQARAEMTRLSQHISELVGEDHGAILQAQLMIMQDRTIEHDLAARIDQGATAEGALFSTLDQYVAAFQKVATPLFQERVFDVKDVFHRLLWQLRLHVPPATPSAASSLPQRGRGGEEEAGADRVILVVREASVMELFAVDRDRLAGIVVEHGGPQSHAAILARSLGIPMVGQVADFAAISHPGRKLLIDGTAGTIVLDPEAGVGAVAAARAEAPSAAVELREGLPRVEVNVNLLVEIGEALRQGADGVGLYRSEFLFLARRTLPTEEEQLAVYRKLVQGMGGRPVCIRTFDLRPDKLAAYSNLGAAASRPFDWRLVLDSPPLQQLFRDQLRAVLRAGVWGPVRVLIPLVTRTELLDFALDTLARAKSELDREGLEFNRAVPLGAMIEVAAAVPLVRLWAERAAFFALGTNDLAATGLGVDRDDRAGLGGADPLHPGLLHLIDSVVSDAHAAGRPVSVCGEVAADPTGAMALAALAVDALSVSVHRLAATRRALSALDPSALPGLRALLLRARTGAEVRERLRERGESR
jgi:phosphotransferase system enzyme I (PtsP)